LKYAEKRMSHVIGHVPPSRGLPAVGLGKRGSRARAVDITSARNT
jgi:hypothetical protein